MRLYTPTYHQYLVKKLYHTMYAHVTCITFLIRRVRIDVQGVLGAWIFIQTPRRSIISIYQLYQLYQFINTKRSPLLAGRLGYLSWRTGKNKTMENRKKSQK